MLEQCKLLLDPDVYSADSFVSFVRLVSVLSPVVEIFLSVIFLSDVEVFLSPLLFKLTAIGVFTTTGLDSPILS